LTLAVHRNVAETTETSQKKPVWATFNRTDIAGRPGASAITKGSEHARACTTMFDAGRGMVDVIVTMNHPGDESQCEKSQEIAKQIAPAMPPKQ
jgi:hypothetical protein